MKETITRKEIAEAAGVSNKTLRRRERDWGLHECRSGASRIPILYFRKRASQILLAGHIISEPL